MATIPAAEFKARCIKLLDEVAATGEPLVVTKLGEPVAQVVPLPPKKKLFGALKGTVLYEGDIVSPLDVEWEANQ